MDQKRDLGRLYETTLRPRLAEIDSYRRRIRNLAIGGVVSAVVGVGSCSMAWNARPDSGYSPWPRQAPLAFALVSIAAFGVAIGRFLIPGATGYMNYRARFKKDVFAEVVRAVRPGAEYFPDRSLPREVYDASGLYRTSLDKFEGDDLVKGFVGETPFEACELHTSYKTGTGQQETTHTVFHGLFFQIDLDRDLRGRTLVFGEPDAAPPDGTVGFERVALDDDAFKGAFAVWSTDAREARELLDAEVRQRLLAGYDEIGGTLNIAFAGRRACGGIHYGRRLFEPTFFKGVDLATLQGMAGQLDAVDVVVRALGLEQGRRRPPDPAFHGGAVHVSEMEAVMAKGDLASIADVAARLGQAEEAGPAAVLPPGREPPAQVEQMGSELSVRFPTGLGILFCTAIAVPLTLLMPLLLANWAAPQLLARVTPLLQGRLPAFDSFLQILAQSPTASLIVGTLVWWYFTSVVRHRPSEIRIGPDGVAIRRVFRPWTFELPLSAIRRVDVSNRMVSLIRADRGLLRAFVMASPTLRDDTEARWLAAQLRRGLAQAGWTAPRNG